MSKPHGRAKRAKSSSIHPSPTGRHPVWTGGQFLEANFRAAQDFHVRLGDVRFRGNGNIVFFNRQDSMEAAVASAIAGGILMPSGIQLETGLALGHVAVEVEAQGGTVMRGVTMESVDVDAGRVVGVTLSTGHLASDCVILAVGAWLNPVLAQVGRQLPLTLPTMQGKDFPLWIRESEGGFTWGTTRGAAPVHRLGGAWDAYGKEQRWRDDLVAAMHADVDRIAEVFPALSGAKTIREIQGMPVYTADGQFFIGEVSTADGLWAAGGDNESGVTHGPGIGRLVADMVQGREPICDPTPYRLDRFNPHDFPDAESVGQHYVQTSTGFIADAHREPPSTA